MEDYSSTTGLENGSLKTLFQKDLVALRGLYSEEVLNLVESNIDILITDYIAWHTSLITVAKNLGVETNDPSEIPNLIEQVTFSNVKHMLSERKPEKIVLGISGPGAVGKETIKTALGFDMVVNTTTRAKRDYENNGEHYNFIDDLKFKEIVSGGGFIVNMERPGRGQYGIQKQDIKKVLIKSKIAIIEENPANLTSLESYLKTYRNCELILVYILPPFPILPHLAARLANRCKESNDDFKLAITSTLNRRQLDEFNPISDSIAKGMNVVFVINDKVERVVGKVKDLVK